MATPGTFVQLGRQMIGRDSGERRDFRALFGVGPTVCNQLWQRCNFHPKTKMKHLLWGLLFLKVYATEPVLCSIADTTRRTFRKWSWRTAITIANQAPNIVRIRVFYVSL